MIVVDASAVVALLNREAHAERIVSQLLKDADRRMSPVSSAEVVMALARKYDEPVELLEKFLRQESISILAIDDKQTCWAHRAFLTYGKGGIRRA